MAALAGTSVMAAPASPQAAPGPFGKVSPANGQAGVSVSSLTLTWNTSSAAVSYEYCYDTTNDGACSTWIDAGASTSVVISGLTAATTYYWAVRARNGSGITYATNGSSPTFWSFLTAGDFSKLSPTDGATGVPTVTSLSWWANGGATFEYCYDTSNDGTCSGVWTSTGSATSAVLSGLSAAVTYYWHVRSTGPGGVVYANGGDTAYWSFTTYGGVPGSFSKSFPSNNGANVRVSPLLSWGASVGAAGYEYCYDATDDASCANWLDAGTNRSAQVSNLLGATNYYWSVRARNPDGTTDADGGAFWTFTTMPAPTAFSKSTPAGGATGVNLSPVLTWTPSFSASGWRYEYCYDTTDDGLCGSWQTTFSTAATLAGLAAETTYYWHVRAVGDGGVTYSDGSATSFSAFTTQTALPGAFNKLAPTGTGVSTSPVLSWSSSIGAGSYEYCYDTTDDGACSTWIDVGSHTSVTLSGLAEASWYFWHVRANNAGGTTYSSGGSTVFYAFATVGALPAPFGKRQPLDGATNRFNPVSIGWVSSPGATGYEYCYDTTNDGACSNWTSVTSALPSLAPGETYYWQLRATNAFGVTYADGSSPAFWSFTMFAGPPGAFTKLSPADGAVNVSTGVSWLSSFGATGYEYCYDTTNDGVCAPWVATPATGAPTSSLQRSTTYYWHVRANGLQGPTYSNGSSTAFWTFTTAPDPPGAFSKLSPSDGAAGENAKQPFAWGPSTGVERYEYCIDSTDDGLCAPWQNAGTSTSVSPPNLTVGTTYFWHVRARNPGGTTYSDSSSSAFWSVTPATVVDADFNGDGKADLLFQSTAGGLYAWFMDGPIRIGGGFLSQSPIDLNLRVAGVRDFTGDGKPDLLLQHQTSGAATLHIMDGLTKVGEQTIPIAANTPWRIVATQDFNRDGHADILWQHQVPVPSQFYVWFMAPQGGMAGYGGSGGAFSGDYLRDLAGAVVSSSFLGVGAGDLDRDGNTDLVLESVMTGSRLVWYLDAMRVQLQSLLSPHTVDPVWKIRAIADYSSDGRPDFIWQHISNGTLYYWQMDGASLGAHGYVWTPVVNPIWTIVGPR